MAEAILGLALVAAAFQPTAVPAARAAIRATSATAAQTVNLHAAPWQDLGDVMPASGDQQQTEVIANASDWTLPKPNYGNLTFKGPAADRFFVASNGCVGQTYYCGVYVNFDAPKAAGDYDADLVFYDDAANSPQSIHLHAFVTPAGVSLSGGTIDQGTVSARLDFGSVQAGTTSPPKTLTVTNSGTGPLHVYGVLFDVPNYGFAVSSDGCSPSPVPAGASCQIQFTFTPNGPVHMAGNPYDITNAVLLDDAGYYCSYYGANCQPLQFTGAGMSPWTGWPFPRDFGGLNIGVTKTIDLGLANLGNTDWIVTGETITGANPANFVITSEDCTAGPVHPGASCHVYVTAHSDAVGAAYAAQLNYVDNTPNHPYIPLAVHGTNGSSSISPSTLDFGSVPDDGTGSNPLTVTITSSGPGALSVGSISVSGPNATDFSLYPANSCGYQELASGSSCVVSVEFYPRTSGGVSRSATLTIDDSTGSHDVRLSGRSSGPSFAFSVNPMNFGTVTRGSPVTLSQTVTNDGNAPFTMNQLPQDQNTEYAVTGDHCSNVTVAPGGHCTFSIRFDPGGTGDRSGPFGFVAGQYASQGFGLVGFGLSWLVVQDHHLVFPETPWNTTSQPQTINYINVGNASWSPASIAVADPTVFSIAPGGDRCTGTVVPAGGSCAVAFVFAPTAPHHWESGVVIDGAPATGFPIEGTGVAGWPGFDPSLAFGGLETGDSLLKSVAVRNIGTGALHVTGATFDNAAGYSLDSQTCQNVPRGGACQLVVRFAPTAVGAANAVMTLTDDEVTPHTVVLTGTGLVRAPCAAATLSASPSATLTAGGSVTLTAGSATCALPRYQFLMKQSNGSWSTVQPYGATTAWTWSTATGLAAGRYSFMVQVRDDSSVAAYDTSATIDVQVVRPPCSGLTITPDKQSPQPVGTTVSLTAGSADCASPLFEFWLRPASSSAWKIVQPYSTSPTYSWTTAGYSGTVYISVWAKETTSATATFDANKTIAYTVDPAACKNATIAAAPPAPQWSGAHVTFTGAAQCPNPNQLYEFWSRPATSPTWRVARPYSTSASFDWNSTGAAGTVYVSVWVKDARSTTATFDTNATTAYQISTATCSTVTIAAAPPTVTASASGCSNPSPLYEFWVRPASSNTWRMVKAYSTDGTFDWSGAGLAGDVYISVWAKDSASVTGTFDANATVLVHVS